MNHLDVAIVGGGPAGLAVAIHAARRGLSASIFERRSLPVDKACGEGLLGPGLTALEALGAREYLTSEDVAPIVGIRYLQEDGTQVEARLPSPGGLGIRRLALARALERSARAAGVRIHEQCEVRGALRRPDHVRLTTASGEEFHASLLVAADGLASPLRRAQGLERASRAGRPQRFGLRQHLHMAPWTDFVEVHFAHGVEAYITPVGRQCIGVAFLWGSDLAAGKVSFKSLLQRFPGLERRLAGAPEDSRVRGAGPLLREVLGRTLDRFALVGDAAGYVDAITGEGLALALRGAAALGSVLPEVLARGATRESLLPYERAARALYRRYAFTTHLLLAFAGHPRARHHLLHGLARFPGAFQRVVNCIVETT